MSEGGSQALNTHRSFQETLLHLSGIGRDMISVDSGHRSKGLSTMMASKKVAGFGMNRSWMRNMKGKLLGMDRKRRGSKIEGLDRKPVRSRKAKRGRGKK